MSRELWLLTAKFKRSLKRAPVRPGLDPIIEDLAKAGASIRLAFLTREFEAGPVETEVARMAADRLRVLGGEVATYRVYPEKVQRKTTRRANARA
jgi:hypothetical protein